jgi:hypothetical protein
MSCWRTCDKGRVYLYGLSSLTDLGIPLCTGMLHSNITHRFHQTFEWLVWPPCVMGASLGDTSLIDGNIKAVFERWTEDSQYFSREEIMSLHTLCPRSCEFPGIFVILFNLLLNVEARDQSRSSPPQHRHTASCPPHACLAQPHVRSRSAPPRTAGMAIPWNAQGPATCSLHFWGSSSTASRLYQVLPRTCRSRPSC